MNIVIIEDERMTAEDLAALLTGLKPGIRIVQMLHTVQEAKEWLRNNPQPDLIFSDIQLGDGLSFEIFSVVPLRSPVVFCTAYDAYALEAFRNNGIDYVLKPFSKNTIGLALDKYKMLRNGFRESAVDYPEVMRQFRESPSAPKTTAILVNKKDKIIPVSIGDIALFTIEYKTTQLITFSNQKYFINQTLDELEERCGEKFFRANRQYLINRSAVTEAAQSFSRKLILQLSVEGRHEIIIGKNKTTEFLEWLQGRSVGNH